MARGRGYRKGPAVKKPPLTHFLCLPLVTAASKPQLEESLKAFGNDVSPAAASLDEANPSQAGKGVTDSSEPVRPTIHPKAIRPVGALHCTLGVMSLDDNRLDEAVQLLQKLDITSLLSPSIPISSTTEPLKVDLKGLVSMHSPQSTSILYSAPSDPTERLYPFCLEVKKVFRDTELLVPDDRQLKLHATIVNTIYAKAKGRRRPPARAKQPTTSEDATRSAERPVEGHGPNANAPLKIDARDLLEKYRDFVWAEHVVLDRIAICEMGAKKQFDAEGKVISEEYKEVASIALPS